MASRKSSADIQMTGEKDAVARAHARDMYNSIYPFHRFSKHAGLGEIFDLDEVELRSEVGSCFLHGLPFC
jgi:hypothetical protein